MLECDITYEIEKLEEYLDEEKIKEFFLESVPGRFFVKNCKPFP